MVRGQFDALARLIADQRSRRTAIAALFGAALLGPLSAPVAARRKGKKKHKRRADNSGCVTAGNGVCHECCDDGDCGSGLTC